MIKNFDLRIGDIVRFIDKTTLFSYHSANYYNGRMARGENIFNDFSIKKVGRVIGIYPHIFLVEYEVGKYEKHILRIGISKVDYMLGEVERLD